MIRCGRAVARLVFSRLGKITLALLLLAVLYQAADWRAVGRSLITLDAHYLAIAMLLFVPQTVVSAWRWQKLAAPVARISLAASVRHVLSASALNLVLPSKLGDLGKAMMLPLDTFPKRFHAVRAAMVEKVADVGALIALWLWGALDFSPWFGLGLLCLAVIVTDGRLVVISIGLWSLHLLQIDCFLKAAGVFVDWPVVCARVPAALFAGMLPITMCGLGTRDSVLVWLFSDVAASPAMLAVGTLTFLRYLVPGAVGLLLVPSMLHRRPAAPDSRAVDVPVPVPAGRAKRGKLSAAHNR
ncbi:MAG: lysylphosphatidylglycerol synthase domain-containing protein [Pirellulales bacterium]